MNATEFVAVLLRLYGLYWYVQAFNQLSSMALFFVYQHQLPFYMDFFWVQAFLSAVLFILIGSVLMMRSLPLASYFVGTSTQGQVIRLDMNSSLLCVAYSTVGLWLLVNGLSSLPGMVREYLIAFSQRDTPHPGFWALHWSEVFLFVTQVVIGTFLLIGNSALASLVSRRYTSATPPSNSDAA